MLIAVASKSGTTVDQHFGHAERFLVYDFNQGSPKLLKEVPVEKYCSLDPDHPFRPNQFGAIIAALRECRMVVTAQIGDYPRQELAKAGIQHLAATTVPLDVALRLAHDAVCSGTCQGPKRCAATP